VAEIIEAVALVVADLADFPVVVVVSVAEELPEVGNNIIGKLYGFPKFFLRFL
jgi:hypothetical protein